MAKKDNIAAPAILGNEATVAQVQPFPHLRQIAKKPQRSHDPLGIMSALAGEKRQDIFLTPSYMNESHGGGGFERVPGFDSAPAMTSVISPRGWLANRPASPKVAVDGYVTESQIGPDDSRKPVFNTAAIPWRCVALLRMTFASGRTASGTAWFISAHTLVTAGHNLYDKDHGPAQELSVIPGYSMGGAPYGVHAVTACFWNPAWASSFDPRLDFALVHIAEDPQVGFFGYAAASDDGLKNVATAVNITGYPRDRSDTQYYDGGRVTDADDYFIYHTIDTGEGQSGAPLFWTNQNSRIGLGIHTYGTDGQFKVNRARRITPELYATFAQHAR